MSIDKLNFFGGSGGGLGTENRLTWVLMNLIRVSPIVRAAFLDLVREQQAQAIVGDSGIRESALADVPDALTSLRERECIINTQVRNLVAADGRLIAVGITSEGENVDAEIAPKDRTAVYDGVVTFIAPERRQHQQASLTLTVESKLGPVVGSWQLMPATSSLGEERSIQVDPRARVLAWRDIIGTLTDLDQRDWSPRQSGCSSETSRTT